MKIYLAILGLVFCGNCFADDAAISLNGHYKISHIINAAPVQTYTLMHIPAERGYIYGNHIMFDPVNSTFKSFYTAPCGNDCFPSSTGTYKMEGEQQIRLYLTSVAQHGACENYDKDVQQDLGLFLIEVDKANGAITLTSMER